MSQNDTSAQTPTADLPSPESFYREDLTEAIEANEQVAVAGEAERVAATLITPAEIDVGDELRIEYGDRHSSGSGWSFHNFKADAYGIVTDVSDGVATVTGFEGEEARLRVDDGIHAKILSVPRTATLDRAKWIARISQDNPDPTDRRAHLPDEFADIYGGDRLTLSLSTMDEPRDFHVTGIDEDEPVVYGLLYEDDEDFEGTDAHLAPEDYRDAIRLHHGHDPDAMLTGWSTVEQIDVKT